MDKFLIGGDYVQEYATPLLKAANQHLQELYTELIMPFASAIKGRHLIIVPHGPLHYIPFHALYDGTRYLVDRFTISYAPSASVLRYCIDRETVTNATPLIVGVPDENAPLIEYEVQSLRKLVSDCRTLSGKRATRRVFQREAVEADFIHVAGERWSATRGRVRPDLRLGILHLRLYASSREQTCRHGSEKNF